MNRRRVILFYVLLATPAAAQEKSVRPGINDPFRNPDVAEWVKTFEGESRETFDKRAEVVAACGLKPGMSVADIGAGTGLYTRPFALAVGKTGTVHAVDISQKFLDHIKTSAANAGLANVKTVLGGDRSCHLPRASVDVAFLCDTYHHFEFPERMAASIYDAIKPGGKLVVVDFAREPGASSDWILKHVRAGQATVTREIAAAGFTPPREVRGVLKDNYILIFDKPAK